MFNRLDTFCVLLLVSGFISIISAAAVWHRRNTPGAKAAALLLLSLSSWSFSYIMELISNVFYQKIFWVNVQYTEISCIGVLWLVTALSYASGGSQPTRRKIYLLFIIPLISIALAWTNDWHGMMRSSTWLDINGSTSMIGEAYGPGAWLLVLYNYTLLLVGAVLVIKSIYNSPLLYKSQAITMLFGVFLPWVGSAVYLLMPRAIIRYDITPVTFTISGVAAVLAIYRFGLFDIAPAAREAVVESMNDGLLVIDMQNRVVDINPAFRAVLRLDCSEIIGRTVDGCFSAYPDLMEKLLSQESAHEEIAIGEADEKRYFALQVSSLSTEDNHRIGYVITSHDITLHRREEEQREQLIQDLQKALAEIKTLRGMLPICACCKKIRDDEGYWTGLEQYLSEHSDLQFTHSICPECEKKLYPHLIPNI